LSDARETRKLFLDRQMDEDHLKGDNPHYILSDARETRKLFLDRQMDEDHLKGDNPHYILSDAREITYQSFDVLFLASV
jgi:hypothetical protein